MIWNCKPSSWGQRLLLAVLIVAAASAVRAAGFGGLGRGIPYLLYFPAVTLAALYGGLLAGALATILSSALTFFWVQQSSLSPVESVAQAVFVVSCLLISGICERLHRAQAQAQLAQQKTEAANQQLRREMAERERTELALRETNGYLNNLFNHANAPIIVWDADGKITRFNHAFEEIAGLKAEQVLGRGHELLFPEDQREQSMRIVRRAGAGERFELVEVPIRHTSGSRRIVLWNSAPIFDADGKTQVATIAQGHDITERKGVEEKLHASEAQFRTMANAMPQLAWIARADGFIFWYNQRWYDYTGTTPEQMEGWGWQSVHDPVALPQVMQNWTGSIASGKPFEMEFPLRGADGQYRTFLTRGHPLTDADGRVVQWFGTNTNVEPLKQAEAALRETNEYLENLFNYTNAPIIVWDPQFHITRFNHAFETLTGRTAHEVIGQSLEILFPPAWVESSMALIKQTTGGERWETVEIPIRHLDGLVRTVLWNSATIFTADGKTPMATIAQGHDITERKRADEKLASSEMQYRRLFETTKDGMLILDATTGMVVDVNPFLIELLGFSHEAFLGKKIWELGFFKDIVANQANFLELQQKEYIRYENLALETSNGRRIEVEFTSNVYLVNHQKVIQCSIRDITERKQSEEKRRASEVRYRRLFESAKDGILILDAETGMVLDVNPFLIQLLGFSHEEFLGKKIWELGFFKDIIANQDNFAELQQKEYLRYENLALETGGGRRIEVEFISNVYLVNRQKVIQCSIRDITERKQSEEKIKHTVADLERSNKELEHFAYVASHDLQEPLRMVASYTQLLEHHYAGQLDDKARKYIHYAVDGAVRMQTLINDLLTYSRAGRRGKPVEPTDSHAVLGEAIRNLAVMIREHHAVITNDELPTVPADASQLVLLFQNLLANAIKFRRDELPRVHVSARAHDGMWLFAVQDNGIGIEAQYAERVFVIFQRLHTREEYPGTGIGLAVCQRIVERHGGKIWFESQPGSGTTFFFTMPKCL